MAGDLATGARRRCRQDGPRRSSSGLARPDIVVKLLLPPAGAPLDDDASSGGVFLGVPGDDLDCSPGTASLLLLDASAFMGQYRPGLNCG